MMIVMRRRLGLGLRGEGECGAKCCSDFNQRIPMANLFSGVFESSNAIQFI